MTSLLEKLAWLAAAVLLVPVLVNPGSWLFGLTLAAAWLAVFYGGRYVLEVEKNRREGERGMISDVRYRQRRDRE